MSSTTLLNSFADEFILSVWGTQTIGNIFTDDLTDRIRPSKYWLVISLPPPHQGHGHHCQLVYHTPTTFLPNFFNHQAHNLSSTIDLISPPRWWQQPLTKPIQTITFGSPTNPLVTTFFPTAFLPHFLYQHPLAHWYNRHHFLTLCLPATHKG